MDYLARDLERARQNLEAMLLTKDIGSEEILKLSRELDRLINRCLKEGLVDIGQ